MKAGDLVKVHLLNDLDWREALGVFMGYHEGSKRARSYVFVEGKKLRFSALDVKAIK